MGQSNRTALLVPWIRNEIVAGVELVDFSSFDEIADFNSNE